MVCSHCLRRRKSAIYIHKTWREAAAAVLTEGNISKTLASAVVPSENGFRFIHDKKRFQKRVCDGKEGWTETKERGGGGRGGEGREHGKCAQVSDSETVMGTD